MGKATSGITYTQWGPPTTILRVCFGPITVESGSPPSVRNPVCNIFDSVRFPKLLRSSVSGVVGKGLTDVLFGPTLIFTKGYTGPSFRNKDHFQKTLLLVSVSEIEFVREKKETF